MRRIASVILVAALTVVSCKKTPSTTPVTTKCAEDSDCVWSWKARGNCCVNPCAPRGTAVHVEENKSILAYNESYCTPDRMKMCPQVGACQEAPSTAPPSPLKCAAGACVPVAVN